MLNYTEKCIYILAFLMTCVIFLLFISVNFFYTTVNDPSNQIKYGQDKMRQLYMSIQKKPEETKILINDKNVVQVAKTAFVSKEIEKQNSNLPKETSKSLVEKISTNDEIDIFFTNKWRIKIPILRVDAPIAEGTTKEAMRRTVGHFEQTDKWKGNVALAGHNVGYRCNFFKEIYKLKKGDLIYYSTEKGERKYKVVLNKIIKETDWSYIKNTKDNRLTLITCELNKGTYRRCVQAVEIK